MKKAGLPISKQDTFTFSIDFVSIEKSKKMSETEQKIQNYELGFHFLPETEEDKLQEKIKELEAQISNLGGSVLASKNPRKQHLSYPINHKHYSYFGSIDFKLPSETLEKLSAQLKLNDSLLRFIVLKTKENQKVLRSAKESVSRSRIKTHTPPAKEAKPKEEVKPEEMEKELETALEKI